MIGSQHSDENPHLSIPLFQATLCKHAQNVHGYHKRIKQLNHKYHSRELSNFLHTSTLLFAAAKASCGISAKNKAKFSRADC